MAAFNVGLEEYNTKLWLMGESCVPPRAPIAKIKNAAKHLTKLIPTLRTLKPEATREKSQFISKIFKPHLKYTKQISPDKLSNNIHGELRVEAKVS